MDAYPEHYIATPYLQYVDWALTDQVCCDRTEGAVYWGTGLIGSTVRCS